MNYSELKPQIYGYLGFRKMAGSGEIDALIGECLSELERLQRFRYLYETVLDVPEFLKKEPYVSFLRGCSGTVLSVMTLGIETDRRIGYLGKTDFTRSVVTDACASALLERLSDEYEKTIAKELNQTLTYRFCPGYGGSDVDDLRYIFERLKPEKIGVSLLESNFMLPSKSMAGVIGMGKNKEKSCGNCFMLPHCEYRKEGKRCYGSERK